MSNSKDRDLFLLVQSYFKDHLTKVQGASRHTIIAYRDAARLFLQFLADTRGCSVSELCLDDIVVQRVLEFLDYLESRRNNTISTRNCRLAAVRSLAGHLLRQDPTRAAQYHRILSLRSKKTGRTAVSYLEPEDAKVLIRQPDCRTASGRRDRALILFLYNTGTRVSEALHVKWKDLSLSHPAWVRVVGKGNRDRYCPLWRETVHALRQINRTVQPQKHVFLNARGLPLTRDGVAYLLRKYAGQAGRKRKAFKHVKVTPHTLRHSCAVALLQSGVDITVIRDYLGHVSISTTSKYVSTNMKMKREVLEAFWDRAGLSKKSNFPPRQKSDVLTWLDSI